MSEPKKTCVLQSQVGDPQKFEETWNVQIFRSIDSSSAAGLPHTQAALKMGLSAQKGKIVDFSIQARAGCLVPLAADCYSLLAHVLASDFRVRMLCLEFVFTFVVHICSVCLAKSV